MDLETRVYGSEVYPSHRYEYRDVRDSYEFERRPMREVMELSKHLNLNAAREELRVRGWGGQVMKELMKADECLVV